MSTENQQPETRRQCRHIHTDGRRCGSPTLRGASAPEHFCFYHHTTRKPLSRNETQSRHSRRASFDLPNPEDRAAIQHAIGQVLIRIAANQIDPRRAGLLLYGLQIASLNLPKPAPQTTPSEAGDYVQEVIADPIHGPLAPEANYTIPKGEKSLEQILMEQWEKDKQLDEQRAAQVLNIQAQSSPEAPTETQEPIGENRCNRRKSVLIFSPEQAVDGDALPAQLLPLDRLEHFPCWCSAGLRL